MLNTSYTARTRKIVLGLGMLLVVCAVVVVITIVHSRLKQHQLAAWSRQAEKIFELSLGNMQEPSLRQLASDPSAEVYRVVLSPSFTPALLVRVEVGKDGAIAHAARVEVNPDRKGPLRAARTTTKVSREAIEQIRAEVVRARLERMPAYDVHDMNVVDGTGWVLEVVRDGHYHVVHRGSPDTNGDARGLEQFTRVCRLILVAGQSPDGLPAPTAK
ncbi:MAG: hypothetical protein A3K19_15410 [Lentisphaerae bacterium RIFOXYB12_FULL_65_16]|nr:MAG: hypothetical protein A3K18_26535 [Lentisphaerae bacterium RIFOXYA12_64_32]OGV88487.1 MAG: hypothetical protein A3K19_15410 [Lentisphaerae bacterium RIFOXYB12_FULL_65_16]